VVFLPEIFAEMKLKTENCLFWCPFPLVGWLTEGLTPLAKTDIIAWDLFLLQSLQLQAAFIIPLRSWNSTRVPARLPTAS
jgi:hypothetical protein